MSEPTTPQAVPGDASELNESITRSLGSIWQRHAGGRPGSLTVEIGADVVRCTRTEASKTDPDEAAEALAAGRSTGSTAYKNEAMAAVRRLTHRRVTGFVAKANAKTDVATEAFILEAALPKN